MNTLGLYIHVPFCKSKCRYCDFCSFPHPDDDTVSAYVDELVREIRQRGQEMQQASPTVDTVYFGGGTPTFLSIAHWERLLHAVFESFNVSPTAEITSECNPATADLAYFRALRALGLNRLSIGVQSMNDRELKLLGRLHRAEDATRTLCLAREAGFDNISVDVMFGIPEETRESLAETLHTLCSLSPDHISVYGLQIEQGTYFHRHLDELALPDEDTERGMYMDAVRILAQNGLPRYEISNFAREGRQSRHNLKYWLRHDYLGLGLAAHSCLHDRRFSNTENLSDYLAGNRQAFEEHISENDRLCESVMLGMRLDQGVDFAALEKTYGSRVMELKKAFLPYVDSGFITENGDRLSFTDEGMYVSNTILGNVLDFDE